MCQPGNNMSQSWESESRDDGAHLKSNKKLKYIEIFEMLHEKELLFKSTSSLYYPEHLNGIGLY